MARGQVQNEAAVSQGVVLPILNALGWPVFDISKVVPQFSLEGRRVDYALCVHAERPVIFMEVKAVGKADGADRQLFEYAFHKGVPLAILADGREWHFYLPAEEGEYQERRVYKLDIVEREPEDISQYFERYLQYDRVCSGKALEAARSDYQDVSRRRKINATLPNAWNRLIEEKDEILLELLAEKVEDLCGYKPELDVCSQYIDSISSVPAPTPIVKPSDPTLTALFPRVNERPPIRSVVASEMFTLQQLVQKDSISKIKPLSLQVNEQEIPTKNWSDLCIKLVQWLLDNEQLKLYHLPIYNVAGRDKYFINSKREHADPRKDGYWKQVGNVYVDVKYNVPNHVKNIIYLLEHIHAEALSVKIRL